MLNTCENISLHHESPDCFEGPDKQLVHARNWYQRTGLQRPANFVNLHSFTCQTCRRDPRYHRITNFANKLSIGTGFQACVQLLKELWRDCRSGRPRVLFGQNRPHLEMGWKFRSIAQVE